MLISCTNTFNISHANNRLVTVLEAILLGRQSCKERQCLYENLMSHMNSQEKLQTNTAKI